MRAFHWSLDVCALAIKRETQQRLVDGHPDLSARPLMVIVAIGVTVGILAGAWWGVGAAMILLAISEVTERVQRSRT